MASTSSPALSLSKLDFPLFSSQRKMQNLHQVKIPRRLSKFSGAKSNGFVLFSSLNGQTGETNPPSVEATTSVNNVSDVQVQSSIWNWRGYSIRYQHAGNSGPALVLIHGFGANSDHWRKNLPVLSKSHRVYSIDLIGYGYSDRPNPRQFGETLFYTFETWATQLNDFCTDVVKGEAFFICNSIGGLVGLQAAVMEPQLCKGIMLLNISLRMLHITKQPWCGRPLIKSFQNLLRVWCSELVEHSNKNTNRNTTLLRYFPHFITEQSRRLSHEIQHRRYAAVVALQSTKTSRPKARPFSLTLSPVMRGKLRVAGGLETFEFPVHFFR
ncbi:uncharacterized protein LOC126591590 isoform X2 [Malus sylvestris]|uniref:uncharacterized protein LOC126591588 isoform X2 n=1 Tax=Malus sylvestris TaxID=3752 RepID=UPI0021AD4DF8|nr:uncharacterized protein LOC126591588 isoform X2 [Malus sylvestris]XP_050113294.1 uncharacterized protein LOC126591590 isoform X2 [Malus sylvestris]